MARSRAIYELMFERLDEYLKTLKVVKAEF